MAIFEIITNFVCCNLQGNEKLHIDAKKRSVN